MAVAHAAAAARGFPLWRYLAGDGAASFLPLPEIQIFGGGAHAHRRVDIQDFMVVAPGASSFAESLECLFGNELGSSPVTVRFQGARSLVPIGDPCSVETKLAPDASCCGVTKLKPSAPMLAL